MKRTILDNISDRLTVKPTSLHFVFNFFLPSHKFFNSIFVHGTSGTFAFAATHEANPKAKAKEPLLQRFISSSYLLSCWLSSKKELRRSINRNMVTMKICASCSCIPAIMFPSAIMLIMAMNVGI